MVFMKQFRILKRFHFADDTNLHGKQKNVEIVKNDHTETSKWMTTDKIEFLVRSIYGTQVDKQIAAKN